jgi:peptide deformylase
MAVLPIVSVGDPVLRAPTRKVSVDELASSEVQGFVDDMIETMRAASGAGLAAPQVGSSLRIAVAEVREGNPRYPYKPPLPLTVMVNPVVEPIGTEAMTVNEGCLSVPGLRGDVPRALAVRVGYLDRDGAAQSLVARGLSAGTFQHEADHLDGVLFLDRVSDPTTFTTWEEFERHHREAWLARAAEIERRAREVAA